MSEPTKSAEQVIAHELDNLGVRPSNARVNAIIYALKYAGYQIVPITKPEAQAHPINHGDDMEAASKWSQADEWPGHTSACAVRMGLECDCGLLVPEVKE